MIIVLVQLPLPPRDRETALAAARESAPRFRALAEKGLLKKYYLNGETGGGGVYVWRSRADAEAWYTPEWAAGMEKAFGVAPRLTWYESLLQVDNVADAIVEDHVAA